jgi:hypothetical protein
LLPSGLFACSCASELVVNNFQKSQFVAKAKLIKITPDPANEDYHDAEIQIIELYKGEHLAKIKIASLRNTSCSFMPQENSTWIIFASVWQGKLSFGMCSGSLHLDESFDPTLYPNAAKNHARTVKLKEDVISFLKERSISDPNLSLIRPYLPELGTFKGYKNKNRFAAFQVDVNADFSIAAIKQLEKFENRELNTLVLNSLKKNLKLSGMRGKPLAKPERIILFCYYYDEEGSNQSFLSFMDV